MKGALFGEVDRFSLTCPLSQQKIMLLTIVKNTSGQAEEFYINKRYARGQYCTTLEAY